MTTGDGHIDANAERRLEAEWVLKARDGDATAFEQLVRRYHRRAVALAYRLLGNGDDARDVSQDAFVRAYRCLDQLDDPEKFGGWFMRVVSNLSLNFRRARSGRLSTSLDDMAALDGEFRNPRTGGKRVESAGQDDEAREQDLKRAVDRAMQALPDQQRMALILFSVEGMPQKEVAELLGCSIEMVKWNVFQARKKMRDLLEDYI